MESNRDLTEYLNQLFLMHPELSPQELMDKMHNTIQHYRDEASKHINKGDEERYGLVQAFYDLIDDMLSKMPQNMRSQIKCKKGCAFCCHIRVTVSLVEAQYIYATCKENGIEIDVEYLSKQAMLQEDQDFTFSEVRACVFLDKDKTCKVYDVRPISCRKYLVASDPSLCDTQTGKHAVAVLATINEDLAGAGLMEADKDWGNFPAMLLRAIKLDREG